MADIAALKKKKVEDPDPPTPTVTTSNLDQAPRHEVHDKEARASLQLKVPQSMYDLFSEQAAREFGFKKGSKIALFKKMWEGYQRDVSA